ncbi:hypothetical protein ACFLWA_13620, partial [Chloroflexota bacterium]
RLLSGEITGAPPPPYTSTAAAVGEGDYHAGSAALTYEGLWEALTLSAEELGADEDVVYAIAHAPGARANLTFNGQKVEVIYSTGPDHGIWAVQVDGWPLLDDDTGDPLEVDGYNSTDMSRTPMMPTRGRTTTLNRMKAR